MPNIATILKLLEEGVKIKDAISREIAKEKDARRRKKLRKAIKKAQKDGDLAAVRSRLFDL